MLTHKYRFHGYKSLGFVFRHGLVVRSRHLLMRIHQHPNRVHSRVAVVVSKKVAKKAHDRNRIRRRIYETVRVTWEEINAPYDLVFIAMSAEIATMSASELKEEILQLLKQGQAVHEKR